MRSRFRKEGGSLVVAALMLFIILLALGLGIMSSQASRMRLAQAQTEGVQARALALAGWDDVKVKLGKDCLFPQNADTQEYFSYSEDVYNEAGVYIGNYTVIVDLRWHAITRDTATNPDPTDPAYNAQSEEQQSIYAVTCVGKLAPARVGEITAERTLYYELDMKNWRVIRMEDRGSL